MTPIAWRMRGVSVVCVNLCAAAMMIVELDLFVKAEFVWEDVEVTLTAQIIRLVAIESVEVCFLVN